MDKPRTNLSSPPSPSAPTVRQIDSKTLLGRDGQVIIVHEGQHYQLRKTQAGKLILTK